MAVVSNQSLASRCICVIVTRDRPALLDRCLRAIRDQQRRPDLIIVVDNASGRETGAVLARHKGVRTLRLPRNIGGAGGFHAGISLALECGADWLWLMDDDGRPQYSTCLSSLLGTAAVRAADLVGAFVLDVDHPHRLAFPIRIRGRTWFAAADVTRHGTVAGFAHLFNGALISAGLFRRIGLPDPRYVIRGDEVEFLLRARRAGACIALDTQAGFLHPSSQAEIHPILGGLFYATMPTDPAKQYFQFRNRAFIFSRYSMWVWLAADVVRYGIHFLAPSRLDLGGLGRWAMATGAGLAGRFMRGAATGLGDAPLVPLARRPTHSADATNLKGLA